MSEEITLEEINKIIDKHIEKQDELAKLSALLGNNRKLEAHAGAITGLILLKREVNGEVEY